MTSQEQSHYSTSLLTSHSKINHQANFNNDYTHSFNHSVPSPNSPVAIMSTTDHAVSNQKENSYILKKIEKPSKKNIRSKSLKSILNDTSTTSSKSTIVKKVRSSKSNIPGESRYWTPSEHKLFIEALLQYGPKDLKSISRYVGTRNMIQCRTHEQKCFMRLMREAQRETIQRNEQHHPEQLTDIADIEQAKSQKDVYAVPSSCGISLLCCVIEEVDRSLND